MPKYADVVQKTKLKSPALQAIHPASAASAATATSPENPSQPPRTEMASSPICSSPSSLPDPASVSKPAAPGTPPQPGKILGPFLNTHLGQRGFETDLVIGVLNKSIAKALELHPEHPFIHHLLVDKPGNTGPWRNIYSDILHVARAIQMRQRPQGLQGNGLHRLSDKTTSQRALFKVTAKAVEHNKRRVSDEARPAKRTQLDAQSVEDGVAKAAAEHMLNVLARLGGGVYWQLCRFGCEPMGRNALAPDGLMQKRHRNGNEVAVAEGGRWFKDGVNPDDVQNLDRKG
ncbi:hypothetical protein JCM3770_002884 [Rhodotorula araucariae]